MPRRKLFILAVGISISSFACGFVLRPVIAPTQERKTVAGTPAHRLDAEGARGTQFFAAHIEEARRVADACREGTVHGPECVNAETAIITVESKERFTRFRREQ